MRLRLSPAVMLSACLLIALLATPALAADAAPASPGTGTSVLNHWVFPIFDYLVLSLLTLASIAGIALAIDAMLHIRESKIAPAATTEHLRSLIASKQYRELLDFTATDSSFVSRALHAAVRRAYLKYSAMREAMESSIGEQTADLFRRIEPLNVIGNIGPLLGLLGTVLGMIMAFFALRETAGVPDQSKLAGGIGTALWHTFFGLFVAIPCLVVYGFYRTRVDKIATRAALVAEELLEGLRPEPGDQEAGDSSRKKSRSPRETPPLPQPQAGDEERRA